MNDSPIFILGCTKSGTTLMRNLFDGHKNLFVIPTESHFFQNIRYWVSYYTRKTKPQNLNIKYQQQNLLKWIEFINETKNIYADGFTSNQWDMNIFKEIINEPKISGERHLSDLYVQAIYKSLMNKDIPDNIRFVEKSVENTEFALDWLQLYPNVKFVHILRNPYSNLVAIRRFLAKKKSTFPVLKPAVYSMYNSYYYLYKNQRLIKDYKVVKYEELLKEPEVIMKDVAKFLDIEYDEILTKPTLFGELWQGNSTSNKKFSGIDPQNADKWKKEITPLEIRIVNELFDFVLKDFGYEKIDTNKSLLKYNKGEGIRNYFLNRMLWYYMPRF